MQLPKAIERYYTAALFRLIQFELSLRQITVTKHEDLAAMHYTKIGRYTTMNAKEDIICTYTDPERIETGLSFTFNKTIEIVEVPGLLMALWPALLWWDAIRAKAKNLWFDLKYKLVK